MGNYQRASTRVDMLEASLASGVGQAIAGWALEYTHSLLESDPELRAQLRRNWALMFERIARTSARAEKARGRRGTRRRT
jgi:hypothetical protein